MEEQNLLTKNSAVIKHIKQTRRELCFQPKRNRGFSMSLWRKTNAEPEGADRCLGNQECYEKQRERNYSDSFTKRKSVVHPRPAQAL